MNNFTEEQQAAIAAAGKTIVSASAGSGKTTVMIEKIVRLITSGVDVREILAVTFTKKAAAQMKEKLRKALIKAINSPDTSAAQRSELKKQLAEVPGADISTIHSFCSKLIRSHFFAAGVDSDFSVIAEKKERQPPARYSHGYLFETAYAGGLQRLFEKCRFLYRGKIRFNRGRIVFAVKGKMRVVFVARGSGKGLFRGSRSKKIRR